MERQPYGMLLKTESFFILAKTEDWIYFQTGDRVSRTRNQQGGRLGEILELLSGKSEFYIRNKELPLFFGQVLPAIAGNRSRNRLSHAPIGPGDDKQTLVHFRFNDL